MEEGSLRSEPNVSIRPKGSNEFHTKTELKNINSFGAVVKGIQYEIERQARIVDEMGWDALKPETRGFNVKDDSTFLMRTKERPDEYRYFPEPDLPKLEINRTFLAECEKELVAAPYNAKKKLMENYGIDLYQANLIVDNNIDDFFENTVMLGANPVLAANWITSEIFRLVNEKGIEISDSKLKPVHLNELIEDVNAGVISFGTAKDVLAEVFVTGQTPSEIIIKKGLIQISSDDDIIPVMETVLNANSILVERYINGEEKLLGVLIGEVMKAFKGKGNPSKIRELLINHLNSLKGH
jgi:aspartyl-tRNA(Asn)/glutamyl-tRNA(Gln) amidotransferase subunit B